MKSTGTTRNPSYSVPTKGQGGVGDMELLYPIPRLSWLFVEGDEGH